MRAVLRVGCALVGISGLLHAVEPLPPGDLEIKAAFVLNFLRLTNWQPVSGERSAVELPICATQRTDYFEAVRVAAEGKTVGARTIVCRIEPAPGVRNCRVLLVDRPQYASVRPTLRALRNEPVLTVGNGPGFIEAGGMFELFLQDGKVRFDGGQEAIRMSRLDISGRLLQLSRNLRKGGVGLD